MTRPTPATVVVRLALLPFQKLAVYPPLVVAGWAQSVFGTFAVENVIKFQDGPLI